MTVLVPVALDLHGGARVQPIGERLADAEAELVEAEVQTARLGQSLCAPGELRHDLGVGIEVGGSDEEPGESKPAELGLGQPDHLQDVLAEVDLLLTRRRDLGAERARRRRGRSDHGRSDRARSDRRRSDHRRRRDRRRRRRRGDSRLARQLEPVQPLVETTNFFPECLPFLSAETLAARRARKERGGQGTREDSDSDDGSHARLLCIVRDRCRDLAPRGRSVHRTDGACLGEAGLSSARSGERDGRGAAARCGGNDARGHGERRHEQRSRDVRDGEGGDGLGLKPARALAVGRERALVLDVLRLEEVVDQVGRLHGEEGHEGSDEEQAHATSPHSRARRRHGHHIPLRVPGIARRLQAQNGGAAPEAG